MLPNRTVQDIYIYMFKVSWTISTYHANMGVQGKQKRTLAEEQGVAGVQWENILRH
jgi:hypothetical protein